MAIPDAWDPEADSGKTKWVEHVEVDGKMQPAPKGMEADLTIKEETLWKTEITKGVFKKETETWKLTNLRAMRGGQYVMLKDCEDIVVANINKKRGGASTGDIQFIKQGSPAIIFTGVEDPDRLAEMARAANEKVLAMIRDAEEKHAAEKGITCSQCNRENPARAKFCNSCGRPL
jgi:zinc ribbon protein